MVKDIMKEQKEEIKLNRKEGIKGRKRKKKEKSKLDRRKEVKNRKAVKKGTKKEADEDKDITFLGIKGSVRKICDRFNYSFSFKIKVFPVFFP